MWMTTTHFRPGIYNRHIARTMTSLFLCPLYPVSSDCFSLNFLKNLFQLGYMFIYIYILRTIKNQPHQTEKILRNKKTNPTPSHELHHHHHQLQLQLAPSPPFNPLRFRQCWFNPWVACGWDKKRGVPVPLSAVSGILQILKVPSNVSPRRGNLGGP